MVVLQNADANYQATQHIQSFDKRKKQPKLFETETPRKAIFFPLVSKNISLLHSKMRSSLTNYITSFIESQNPKMVWVRRDIKVDLAPSPCHGQGLD